MTVIMVMIMVVMVMVMVMSRCVERTAVGLAMYMRVHTEQREHGQEYTPRTQRHPRKALKISRGQWPTPVHDRVML